MAIRDTLRFWSTTDEQDSESEEGGDAVGEDSEPPVEAFESTLVSLAEGDVDVPHGIDHHEGSEYALVVDGFDMSGAEVRRDRKCPVRIDRQWWEETGADQMRREIRMAGRTITDVAESIGISQSGLTSNLAGGNPSVRLFDELCDELDIEFDDAQYEVLFRGVRGE